MTDYPAVLHEFVVAGYEGEGLVTAFGRLCVVIGGTTDYPSVLQSLIQAGYEGASLVAAFGRMCAAVCGTDTQIALTVQAGAGIPEPKREPKPEPEPTPIVTKPSQPKARKATTRATAQLPIISYPAPKGAKAIGRKALASAGAALSASATRVGSQLLEHYNVDTGRCDPGLTKVADEVGITKRSAHRAIAQLIAAGLFAVDRNAGHAYANAYFPVWPRLVELAQTVSAGVTKLSPGGDKTVTQNQRTKPVKDPVLVKAPRPRARPQFDRRQRHLPLSFAGGREKAEEAVRAKIKSQLTAAIDGDKSRIVHVWTNLTEAHWTSAIAAEMQRSGTGLPTVLAALDVIIPSRMAQ